MKYAACGAAMALAAAFQASTAMADPCPPPDGRDASAPLGQFYPRFCGEGYLQLRFDGTPQSDDSDNQRLNLFLNGEANLGLSFTPEFSIRSRLKVDSVRGPAAGRDRYISGTGAFLEQLYLDYQTDTYGAQAGKFGPTFGLAWTVLPDFLKDGLAGDFELAEMNGVGGTVKLESLDNLRINAAAFFLDTTFLHRSLFSSPGAGDDRAERISDLRRSDGGLANTGKPNSFSATVDGGVADQDAGLFYQIGFRHLARGRTEFDSENGVSGGIGYNFKMAGLGDEPATITPLFEAAHFWRFNGGLADANVLNGVLLIAADPWSIQLVASWRGIGSEGGGGRTNDYVAGFQVAHSIGDNFEIGAGYRHERLDGVNADVVRTYIGYNFDFNRAFAD